MTDQAPEAYTIHADESNPEFVIVTEPGGKQYRIHQEDADPEHRFTYVRLAAGWFGNLPAS